MFRTPAGLEAGGFCPERSVMLSTLNKIVGKCLYWAIAAIHAAIVVILFAGVVARYVFNAPLFWGEEMSILGLVWLTFLGGAVLVRQNKNVAITIFTDHLPARVFRRVDFVNHILIMICLVVMIRQAWTLSDRLMDSTTPALRFRETWFAAALVIGFVVMLFYQVQRFVAELRNRKAFPDEEAGDERCEL